MAATLAAIRCPIDCGERQSPHRYISEYFIVYLGSRNEGYSQMAIRMNNVLRGQDRAPTQPETSQEAVELMRHIRKYESREGTSLTQPGQVFKVLLEMGFHRDDSYDAETRADEFVRAVRGFLISQKRRSPSYREVLNIVRQLGYERETRVSKQ